MLRYIEDLVPATILQRCAWVPEKMLPMGLYHISANPALRAMSPKIPTRTLRTEDCTFPRICVSSSLVGCIYGHSGTLADYDSTMSPKRGWLGGYVIYRVPFVQALRPSKALLSDVDVTDEHWLFESADSSGQYVPERVGECFISTIRTGKLEVGAKKKVVETDCPVYYFEALEDGFPVWYRQGEYVAVKKGHYRMEIPHYAYRKGVLDMRDVHVEKVTLETYLRAKDTSLVLLGHQSAGSYDW